MVKSFLDMDIKEQERALNFIMKYKNTYKSVEDFKNELNNKICNYGEGIIFYYDENGIKGKLSIILELVEKLKVIYINKIICPYEDENILKALINEAKTIADKYKAKEILIGIRDEKLMNLTKKLGLNKSYSSFKMILKNKSTIYNTLETVKLSNKNIEDYVNTYNKSFMDMPHGTFIEIEDAKEYLENKDPKEDYFIIIKNNEKIGFLSTVIEDNKGFFDIGLIKEYRGKGYGKKLLETAIEFFKEKNVDNICLIVIEKNEVAFEMYKKRGFEVYEKLSDWIEIYL